MANKPPAGRRLRLATSSKERYEICSGRERERERKSGVRGEWPTDSQVEKSGITRSSEQLVWLETEEALETATVDEAGGGTRGWKKEEEAVEANLVRAGGEEEATHCS